MTSIDKVSFLICGAQKAGTTALTSYLRRHPEVVLPEVKEPHFFDCETIDWQLNESQRLRLYHSMFNRTRTGIKGEATPVYMYWRPAAERIWKYNPAMRIIVILRNPVERAYSHWNMEVRRGREILSFKAAIEQEEVRCKEAEPLQHRIYSYIDRGMYCKQIERLWSWFGKENVLIIRHERLRHEPEHCLRSVYKHLGLSPMPSTEQLRAHESVYSREMTIDERKMLLSRYDREIWELEEMLNWDCTAWRDGGLI